MLCKQAAIIHVQMEIFLQHQRFLSPKLFSSDRGQSNKVTISFDSMKINFIQNTSSQTHLFVICYKLSQSSFSLQLPYSSSSNCQVELQWHTKQTVSS